MTDTKRESSQFDLEHFLKNLSLQPLVHGKHAPPMPPLFAQSTMTPLVMRPGGYRKLQEVKGMDFIDREATFFFSSLNSQVGDGEAFKSLQLSTQMSNEDVAKMRDYNPYEIDDRNAAFFLIERGPMNNARKLAQMIDTELEEFKFFTPRRNGTLNSQGIEPIYFCKPDGKGGMQDVKCIVVALPPWEFAPRDFDDFTSMATFTDGCTSMNGRDNDPPWCNAELMWAYLYDLCFMHDCSHFILTSYEQWAFGAFSTYYSTGFVSQTYSFDAKPNSLLELFTYWILAACHTENTVILEQVPREKHIDCDLFEKERHLYRKRLLNDGLMGAGPDLMSRDTRPAKRARKDPLEDRTGWAPLGQHAGAVFSSPRKIRQPRSGTIGHFKTRTRSRAADDIFARPSPRWNGWYKRRATEGKENPLPPPQEQARSDKLPDQSLTPVVRPQFGLPIPMYSLDIDRENDCFRPELIGLATFPLPPP